MNAGDLWVVHVGKELRVPIKVYALQHGISTRELVEAALNEYLVAHAEQPNDIAA